MNLERFDDAALFYQQAASFLLEREAEHNLLLGLIEELKRGTSRYLDPPYLALVRHTGAAIAVALRTPPHPVVLSHTPQPAALELLAADLQANYETLPGVNSEAGSSKSFADIWQRQTGQAYDLDMALRIYKLESVNPVMGVPGSIRRVTATDHDLLKRWMIAFRIEAGGTAPENIDHAGIERTIAEALKFEMLGRFFWEDNGPVSLAGFTGPTPNGIRIGPVYTPPDLRRKGYASALVAALSQQLLDEGRQFCFLYTDLANPTSNHIYMDIGYQPVCDVNVYRFR